MSKYLVTGGAGFIGSHVAAALALRGEAVTIVDDFNAGLYPSQLKHARVAELLEPAGVEVIRGDIRDFELLSDVFRKNKFTHICHLAAWAGVKTSLEKPLMYETVNITGTRHVFELAVKTGVGHVVYASSSSVYGGNIKQPFKESDRVDKPLAPYALSKRANELQAYYYYSLSGLTSTGLRFFTVYGPWGRPDMALFIFTAKILRDEPINVHNYGKMKRDFTYVDDIVAGVVASLDRPMGPIVINLAGNDSVPLKRYIHVLEQVIGKKARQNLLPMQPGEVPSTRADITRAQTLLGYDPKTKVEEGIGRFWAWYKGYYGI